MRTDALSRRPAASIALSMSRVCLVCVSSQLDEAEELSIKKETRKALGRILLKGDNITLMMSVTS